MVSNERYKHTLWNGQRVKVDETVDCPVCGEEVSLRGGWVDPYNEQQYVHYGCLSKKRKREVEETDVRK